jgi:hypothetical protein
MSISFDRKGLDNYVTDRDAELEGVWLQFPEGRKLLIRRAGGANKRYQRVAQTAIKPYRRALDRGTLDPEDSDRVMREVYSKTIVADWDGIKDGEGHDVECTPSNIVAFFNAFPEIFADVMDYATELSTFAEQEITEAQEILGES